MSGTTYNVDLYDNPDFVVKELGYVEVATDHDRRLIKAAAEIISGLRRDVTRLTAGIDGAREELRRLLDF
jgi:hypothetical protein